MMIGNEFAEFLRESEPEAKVLPAAAFREQYRLYRRGGRGRRCATMPWAKTHADVEFRPGEVSVWAGTNGSGKSMVLSHVVLGLMMQGERCVTLSFEMTPMRQFDRFIRQFAGCKEFSEKAEDQFFDWGLGKLWIYDQQGSVDQRKVFAVCKYASARLGVTNVVIDSLMKAVKGDDDYNGQKNFVDALTTIARDMNVHIHLVNHTPKIEDESRIPTKSDNKGSGVITDLVDNLFMVWRNKPKERIKARQDAGQKLTDKEVEKLGSPDLILACEKQRNHDWEGRIALWFNRESWQYIGDARCRPVCMADLITTAPERQPGEDD